MNHRPKLNAVEQLNLIRSLEDQALVELVEDTVERLNSLGDRLERFARGEKASGEARDGRGGKR